VRSRQTPARKVVRGVPDLYISEDPGGEQADPGQECGEGRHAHRAAYTRDGVGHRRLPASTLALISSSLTGQCRSGFELLRNKCHVFF
jgi:hypothetical protein